MMASRRPGPHVDRALMLMLLVMAVSYSTQHFFCPEVSYLGMSASLACIDSSDVHSYLTPSGTTAATCDLAGRRCIPNGAFNASVIDTTSTAITINNVLQSHDGDWVCAAGGSEQRRSTCRMTVAEPPSCNSISLQQNNSKTDSVLTVNTTSVFCSGEMQVQLLTEKSPYYSPPRQTSADITDGSSNSSVNIPGTDLMLIFTCGSNTQNLSREGVQEHGQKCPPDNLQLYSFVLGLALMFLINILSLGVWCICKGDSTSGGRANANNESDGRDQPSASPSMESEPGDDAIYTVIPCPSSYTSLNSDSIYDLVQDYE